MKSPWWQRMLCRIGLHRWWFEPEPFVSTSHCPPSVKRGCGTCGRTWTWSYLHREWKLNVYGGAR